jgi:rare lipoprotein A
MSQTYSYPAPGDASQLTQHGPRALAFFFLIVITLFLSACGGNKRTVRNVPPPQTIPPSKSGSTTASGSQGTITPKPVPPPVNDKDYEDAKVLWKQEGYASWYGPGFHNRRKANGEVFDMDDVTAAHRTLPLNSLARVTNLKTGSSVILRITDRGPFVPDRVIDLSREAAKQIDVWRPGTAKVKIEVLETPKPIESGGKWCVQVGALTQSQASKLKEKLERRYHSAKVLHFSGPTGDWWVRVRVLEDNKTRATEVLNWIDPPQGMAYLVRID